MDNRFWQVGNRFRQVRNRFWQVDNWLRQVDNWFRQVDRHWRNRVYWRNRVHWCNRLLDRWVGCQLVRVDRGGVNSWQMMTQGCGLGLKRNDRSW